MRSKISNHIFFCITLTFLGCSASKSFESQINDHRNQFKNSFLENPRSPLEENDLKYLSFFTPDKNWKKSATFTKENNAVPFEMPTYSGITKPYIIFGYLDFEVDNKKIRLQVYQSAQKPPNPLYKNHLFLPFKDTTNGESTYGGGRYLDLKTDDIKNNKVILDFNQCYNPWCAYSDGYNCPVPPSANHLTFEVNAGEKMYTGPVKKK